MATDGCLVLPRGTLSAAGNQSIRAVNYGHGDEQRHGITAIVNSRHGLISAVIPHANCAIAASAATAATQCPSSGPADIQKGIFANGWAAHLIHDLIGLAL